MKKLEYQKFKKEHIKDFFEKVFSDEYSLTIIDGVGNYHFQFGNYSYGKKEIIERDESYYDYEDFERVIKCCDEFIIDEENKFIVAIDM